MTKRIRAARVIAAAFISTGVCAAAFISTGVCAAAHAQASAAPASTVKQEPLATLHATGTFDVKVTPLPTGESSGVAAAAATLGRFSIDKQYHGDLQGTGKGGMLTVGTEVKGSAAYVAIERVTGTVNGRAGTFSLQHSGTMTRGAPQLTITVVPDSGTGQLAGIAGTLTITIADGKHSYAFDYTLPAAP